MPSLGRVVAYGLTGIPAAIGIAFVARYAYATSDTHDAGLGSRSALRHDGRRRLCRPCRSYRRGQRRPQGGCWPVGCSGRSWP